MACLIVLEGALKGQRVALNQPLLRIGRREENDWVLAHGSVSGTHCEIAKNESGFLIRDLGSTNGTKVNPNAIKEHVLYRNDIILIGEIPVMIEGDDVPQNDENEATAIPRTTIVIPQRPNKEPLPKEFSKKSNSNKFWVPLIILLLLVIGAMLYLFFTGKAPSA